MNKDEDTLRNIVRADGLVGRWPKKREEKLAVLRYLRGKFVPGRRYKESEVNDLLRAWHAFGDHALLRRELYDHFLIEREPTGALYWVEPAADGEAEA